MKVIVGLGNPREKYQNTRHNLGFLVVEELASSIQRSASSWKANKDLKAEIMQINYTLDASSYSLVMVKPQTYMNNSGMAVKAIADYFKIPVENIIIVHDELDLPLGKIKIRSGGAAAGHHGVESVIKHLGDDKFVRIRLGIRPTESTNRVLLGEHKQASFNAEKFVLEPFQTKEKAKVKRMVKEAVQAVELLIKEGLEKAQNSYN